MSIKITTSLQRLERDLGKIERQAPADLRRVHRQAVIDGNRLAKLSAKRNSGKHGKWYPDAFVWKISEAGQAFGLYRGEYGPTGGRAQGSMSFEDGSRNQPAHNDMRKSADMVGPWLHGEVSGLPGKWFWPAP